MKTEKINEYFGKIVLNESAWTGKKDILINGQPLVKIGKNIYSYTEYDKTYQVYVKGSFLTGLSLIIDGKNIELTKKPAWYEFILAWFPLAFILIWGNIPSLIEIFPVISGAIGGLITGVFAIISMLGMKSTKNILFKLLIGFGCIVASIFICFLLALMYLAAIA